MSIVQTKAAATASGTSLTITLDGAVGTGNSLVVIQRSGFAGVGVIQDPTETGGSDVWTIAATQLTGTLGNANNDMAVFYTQSATAGVTAIVLHTGSTASIQGIVYEISGQDATILGDIQYSATDNTGTALEITNGSGITTTSTASLVIAAYSTVANKTFTVGSGYTQRTAQTRLFVQDKTLSSTGTETGPCTISVSGSWVGLIVEIQLTSNVAPTIAPNTADAAAFLSHFPTLEFTGSDTDADTLEYEVQISNVSAFTATASVLRDNLSSGGVSVPVHEGPTGATTWEGNPQTDDRLGQSFTATGGVLDKIAVKIGNDRTGGDALVYPNGYHRIRVYYHATTPLTQRSVTSITNVGATCTVTATAHGYVNGQLVSIQNADDLVDPNQGTYNGTFKVTVTGANTFTYQAIGTPPDDSPGAATGTVLHAALGIFGTTSAPLNPADPADTPTPGWIAQSDNVTFTTATPASSTFYDFAFSGANRVILQPAQKYYLSIDWVPADNNQANETAIQTDSDNGHAGNAYIDGNSPNFGALVGTDHHNFDTLFKVYEMTATTSFASLTDAGFANTVTGGDTHPFNPGEKASYTVQSSLYSGTWYWRARVKDPTGSNTFSSYTTTRSFTIADPSVGKGLLLLGVG